MKTLRFILGDQLNLNISSLNNINKKNDVILLCEVWDEATYVKHHKKKIAFIFSAMRHFSEELKAKGYDVDYIKLDDTYNTQAFTSELKRGIDRHNPNEIIVTSPSEYRVLQDLLKFKETQTTPISILNDDRFLCQASEFSDWAEDKKVLRMEYFYRMLRKKHSILMDGDQPVGGQWNFDSANRKPPKKGLTVPKPFTLKPDKITTEVIILVEQHFPEHFGDLEPFYFAVTRKQALKALQLFIDERLSLFGDYQDAMIQNEAWMFHSHISFYLNCGLLLPLECIQAAEKSYLDGLAPLNAVEGFIRQIAGWREYIRGIYWLKMPSYAEENFLNAEQPLPEFFWTGNTKMNCLKQCITETKTNAYAHHIQRLMVLGNFLLLAGINPKSVNEWYLIVYADAFEWVEMPNVTGMILFADSGIVASKPYAASGAYINKMSNYCKNCHYDVKQKTGGEACPFNYLYWNFLIKNRPKLKKNQRLRMIYSILDKMDQDNIKVIIKDSQNFIDSLNKE